MPIVTCEASKATPAKGLNYIFDPEKTLASGSWYLLSEDPREMAAQMMKTMHLHHKGWDKNERKYYHTKVSFDPRDLPENGGTLTVEKANSYAYKYAQTTWPGREVAWSVQHHGKAMHVHFIVAACDLSTGKKLDARRADYNKWKDRADGLAVEMGLSALDWREALAKKHDIERQDDVPVKETFAEQGIKARGSKTWKDEIRAVVDRAASHCESMSEFRAELERGGVIITRCSDTVISYKLGDHKAVRGDSLGGDYTAMAVRSALESNAKTTVPDGGRRRSLDSVIGAAERVAESGGRVIGRNERQVYRDAGRFAGMKRAEIDRMCDRSPIATWEEKQRVWNDYKAARERFWTEYNARKESLQNEIDEAYRHRRKVRDAEWAMNPRNRKITIIGSIVAAIFLAKTDSSETISQAISALKREQRELRDSVAEFKARNEGALGTLRQKNLPLDKYIGAVKQMHDVADWLWLYNGAPVERMPGRTDPREWVKLSR